MSNLYVDNIGHLPTIRIKKKFDNIISIPFIIKKENIFHISIVAGIIHIYYPELCDEIMKYLQYIPCIADIYISTDTFEKREKIAEAFKSYTNGKVEIRIAQNVGRDVAPMFVLFKDVFENYNYFFHIHTKKSPQQSVLEGWREYLFSSLLGSKQIIESNLFLLQNEIGVIFPDHYSIVKRIIYWHKGDYFKFQELMKRCGIDVDYNNPLEFPSSTMFWARTDIFKPLLELNLTWDDFNKEEGQISGTLAHSIERTVLYLCELKYKWVKIKREENQAETKAYGVQEINEHLERNFYSLLEKRPELIALELEKLIKNRRRVKMAVNLYHLTLLKIKRRFKIKI